MFTIVVTLISAWLVLGPLFAESLTRYSSSKQRTNTDDDRADSLPERRSETGEPLDSRAEGCPVPAMFVPVFLVTVAALTLIVRIPETPRGLIAYGRNLAGMKDLPEFLFVAEGMNASLPFQSSMNTAATST